jgi:hypothetical protein
MYYYELNLKLNCIFPLIDRPYSLEPFEFHFYQTFFRFFTLFFIISGAPAQALAQAVAFNGPLGGVSFASASAIAG